MSAWRYVVNSFSHSLLEHGHERQVFVETWQHKHSLISSRKTQRIRIKHTLSQLRSMMSGMLEVWAAQQVTLAEPQIRELAETPRNLTLFRDGI